MARKLVGIVALLALLLVGLVLWILPGDVRVEARTEAAATAVTAHATLPPSSGVVPTERVELPAGAEEAPAPAPSSADTTESPAPEQPDLEARDWLEIRVVDPEERPVFDAELRIDGLRKQGDEGSWYAMRDAPALARTDARGVARIWHSRWVDIDGRTVSVDLGVTHAEFAPFRDYAFPVGPGQRTVVLQRGAALTVTGWYGTPDARITELSIQVDTDAELGPDAWTRAADGRLMTLRLAPGSHLIRISHEDPERGKLASAIEPFELLANEWKELSLELFARTTLYGRLDESVPRPVHAGHVWVNLHQPAGVEPSLDQDFEATVREDGSFVIEDVPPGTGQIIAWCGGWVSQRTRPDTPEEAGFHPTEPPAPDELEKIMAELDDSDAQAQRIVLPAPEPVVVRMEATGALELTVRTQAGAAVAGASVWAAPNVQWIGVGSTIFPWGQWEVQTDAQGRARIEGLPPDGSLWFGAEHPTFRMTRADRDQTPSAQIVSGQTTVRELVMEPNE